jgi:hypothetical protein
MNEHEMFEMSFRRPKNFFKLSAERQWEIDKELGILDWEGGNLTDEEMKRFRAHYDLKEPEEKIFTEKEAKNLCKKILWDYIKNNAALKGTDFHDGISVTIKSYKKTNIDSWFNQNK